MDEQLKEIYEESKKLNSVKEAFSDLFRKTSKRIEKDSKNINIEKELLKLDYEQAIDVILEIGDAIGSNFDKAKFIKTIIKNNKLK